MAFSAWHDLGFKQVWTNGFYCIDLHLYYQQDQDQNETKIDVAALRIRSVASGYSFHNTVNGSVGYGADSSTRKSRTVSLNVPVYSTQTHAFGDSERVIRHNSGGGTPDISVQFYVKAGVNGLHNAPELSWTSVRIDQYIPSIEPARPRITASVMGKFLNGVKVRIRNSGSRSIDQISWISQKGWAYINGQLEPGQSQDFIITDDSQFLPNVTYQMKIEAKEKGKNIWSPAAVIKFTTIKPNAPVCGEPEIISNGNRAVTVQIHGHSFSEGSTWGYFRHSFDGSSWINDGTNAAITIGNLREETDYTIYFQLVDSFGTTSESVPVTFTSAPGIGTCYVMSNAQWRTGEIWIKNGGTWKPSKKCFIKKYGKWEASL